MPDIQIKRGTRSAFTSLKSGSGLIVGQPYYITDENVLAIADTTSTASEYGVSDNFPISKLNIDGGTDIGAALVDGDLMIVDDGANGTNRKSAMSRLYTYISGKITGAISGLLTTNLTASRALVSDGSGKIVVASGGTTATEIGYLNGVTSAIQGQLDGKGSSGILIKTTAEISTSTSLQDDDQLSWTVPISGHYVVEVGLYCRVTTGSSIKFKLNNMIGAIIQSYKIRNGQSSVELESNFALGQISATNANISLTNSVDCFFGLSTCSIAGGGTLSGGTVVTVQWSAVNGGDSVTVYRGSYLKWTKM